MDDKRPTLTLTVGLPRSGKTTWAREQGVPMVNPDSIRLALHGQAFRPESEPMVWAIAETMVRALFLAGHAHVILDATNVTRERRARWEKPDWETRFAVFEATVELCKWRARDSQSEHLLPVIDRMAATWEPLTPDEAGRVVIDEPVGEGDGCENDGPAEGYPAGWWHCHIHLNPVSGEMHSDGDHRVRKWIEHRVRATKK